MPFNNAIILGSRTVFALTDTGGTGEYDIESQIVSQYGTGSFPGSLVLLTLTGKRQASSTAALAIDATGLDPEAELTIDIGGNNVHAKGGAGGQGGNVGSINIPPVSIFANNGGIGKDGGDAISLGCNTTITGTGFIRGGFGGGGGGASEGDLSGPYELRPGSGGGGGAPEGSGGAAGSVTFNDPGGPVVNGSAGANAVGGAGGAGGTANKDGGDGGDNAGAAEAGENSAISGKTGGAAGNDGFTVVKNGFTLTKLGSVIYQGNEAA